ncbi:MAG: FkbM family methyltransferase [Actinomycetota bacterium]
MTATIERYSVGGEEFFACTRASIEHVYEQVFVDREYDFSTDAPAPNIIDCGAHYGVATIFFLKRYPQASVLAFEPDPTSAEVFRMNIELRALERVRLVEAAVSDYSGDGDLFGEFDGQRPDSQGSSLLQAWGDRGYTTTRTVNVARLSDHIDQPVDFLKLNIEGAELQVVRDLSRTGRLELVRQLYVQFHQTRSLNSDDEYREVLHTLESAGFEMSKTQMSIREFLPPHLDEWADQSDPRIRVVRAVRSDLGA